MCLMLRHRLLGELSDFCWGHPQFRFLDRNVRRCRKRPRLLQIFFAEFEGLEKSVSGLVAFVSALGEDLSEDGLHVG